MVFSQILNVDEKKNNFYILKYITRKGKGEDIDEEGEKKKEGGEGKEGEEEEKEEKKECKLPKKILLK